MSDLPNVLRSPLSPNVELLLDSAIPARLAWVDGKGHPRVVPIWFHWTGEQLAVATFAGARKLDEITSGTVVAVTIDSQTFPYRGLKIRGPSNWSPIRDSQMSTAMRLSATWDPTWLSDGVPTSATSTRSPC